MYNKIKNCSDNCHKCKNNMICWIAIEEHEENSQQKNMELENLWKTQKKFKKKNAKIY